jgi:hypothetical protein
MTNAPRRFRVVTLPRPEDDSELAAMRREIASLQAAENSAVRRQSTKSKAAAKALEFDKRVAQAEKDAREVTVNELAYDEFGPLQDLHPPRKGNDMDEQFGYNRDTFPLALIKASMVEQDAAQGATPEELLADLIAKGDAAWADLGGKPGRLQYARLESAAFEVNVGDDSLPKFSAVSLLEQAKKRASEQLLDSE